MEKQSHDNKSAVTRMKKALIDTSCRVVTIWGAGASINSGVPSGYYILERMKKDLQALPPSLICQQKTVTNDQETSSNEITAEQLISQESMEEILQIYADIYGFEGLHQWLRQFIPQKDTRSAVPYFPTFAHEYSAHLANSLSLRYFISLNFDEILEATFEEEFGAGEFQVIASLSEFERLYHRRIEDWDAEFGKSTATRFVLKPHGTISRGLSLRHTPSRVTFFELEKLEVLRSVLTDAVIVFLGFGSYNHDFLLLFGETYSRGLTDDIIIVDLEPQRVRSRLSGNRPTKEIYEYKGYIDDFFKNLSDSLHEDANYNRSHQKPTRHYIRTLFFDIFSRALVSLDGEDPYRERHYQIEKFTPSWFDLRIYELELLIYLMKTRGLFIQLASANCYRIQQVLQKCLSWKSNGGLTLDLSPEKILENVLNDNDDQIISNFGVQSRRGGDRALNALWCCLLLPLSIDTSNIDDFDKIVNTVYEKVAKKYITHLTQSMEQIDSAYPNVFIAKKSKYLENRLIEQFKELYRDFDIDITSNDLSIMMRFSNSHPLRNRDELVKHTIELIQKTNWNRLRIATISAEWLTRHMNDPDMKQKTNCNIDIISNLDMFSMRLINDRQIFHYIQMVKSISDLLKSLKGWNGTILSWYALRNLGHHLTVVSEKRQDTEEEYIGATYFWRLGKDTSISPVRLDSHTDMKVLSEYFDNEVTFVKDEELGSDNNLGGHILTARVNNEAIIIERPAQLERITDNLIGDIQQWFPEVEVRNTDTSDKLQL